MSFSTDELTKIKVLIKAFLLCNPGKHTAGEIAAFINEGGFGIVHGVTSQEISSLIRAYVNHPRYNFLMSIQSERKYENSGVREYYISEVKA